MLKKALQYFRSKKIKQKFPLKIEQIETIIRYQFKNKDYLIQAFKHSSYLTITNEPYTASNERLEFLGDAILDLSTTLYLYQRYTDKAEGELSKIKAVLVSRKVLADIVSRLKLGDYMLLNRGEEKTGGRKKTSNLANLYEAIVGAIYLDSDFNNADSFIHYTLLKNSDLILNTHEHVNYKSILLEYAQGRGSGSPSYKVISESGPDHNKQFVVTVRIDNLQKGQGTGKSKKIAEQDAARHLLKQIAPDLLPVTK